jgi:uncharacterized protein (TIGR02466 family)
MTDAKTRQLNLFPTPIVISELEDSGPLNAELEKVIRARAKKDKGVTLSNRRGWQSTHDLPSWAGDAGKTIIDRARALATAHIQARGSGPNWLIESWANISGPGAFNMPHVHGGSFWSCVYYVKSGEGSGVITMHDPRMPMLRMHAPGVMFKGTGPELRFDIKPTPGTMILFPAWLWHSVEPSEGDEDRISIAMNIRNAPRPAARDR